MTLYQPLGLDRTLASVIDRDHWKRMGLGMRLIPLASLGNRRHLPSCASICPSNVSIDEIRRNFRNTSPTNRAAGLTGRSAG